MFAIVNTYTRAAQWDELSAESSFRLSRVGGNIFGAVELKSNRSSFSGTDGESSWSVDREGVFKVIDESNL